MNVCLYVIDELKNYWIYYDYYENWHTFVFFHGEDLYNILIDATPHQMALQSGNFCPVQPIVIKKCMTMYFVVGVATRAGYS